MKLIGRFIVLRKLKPEDAELTLIWRQSNRARLLNKGANTIEQQKQWIIKSEKIGDLNFIIEYKTIPVGMIALHDINYYNNSAKTGRFLIGEQNIVGSAPVAYETELLLLDYVFDELGLHKIYGEVREDNIGMLHFRSYLGYHKDGILRDHYLVDEKYINAVAFSLLSVEYKSNCRSKLEGMIKGFSHYLKK